MKRIKVNNGEVFLIEVQNVDLLGIVKKKIAIEVEGFEFNEELEPVVRIIEC